MVALKVDKRNYPGRNSSGCSRHSHDSRHPPSCKVKAGIYLINATLTASYFILLAGDVSENPGPTKDLCGLCSKICRRNQKAIQCDECDTWYHAKCMDMSNTEYANLCNPSSTWIRDLESALHFLESSKIEIALLGDFNVDMKSSTKAKG